MMFIIFLQMKISFQSQKHFFIETWRLKIKLEKYNYYYIRNENFIKITMTNPKFFLTLTSRFKTHMHRHADLKWEDVLTRLEANPDKVKIIEAMETSGGEPDVVGYDSKTGEYTFYDCSPESPPGRRSLCYDRVALDGRKENKPKGSAGEMADAMGVELLTEVEYRYLQTLGKYDLKTSSWIATPPEVRTLGGALFSDRRYERVFVYHN